MERSSNMSAAAQNLIAQIRNQVVAKQVPNISASEAETRGLQLLTKEGGVLEAPRKTITSTDESAMESPNANYEAELEAFKQASTAPGRRYQGFESTGKRQGLETIWQEKDGKLYQVSSRPVSWSSSWVDFRDNIAKPVAAVAATTMGGPLISGLLGGGTAGAIGAGATLAGGRTALAGGNSKQILRNALIGGTTAGVGATLTPQIGATGARAVTGAVGAGLRGGNVIEGAVMGAAGSVSPQAQQAIRLLQTIRQQQQRQPSTPRRGP